MYRSKHIVAPQNVSDALCMSKKKQQSNAPSIDSTFEFINFSQYFQSFLLGLRIIN